MEGRYELLGLLTLVNVYEEWMERLLAMRTAIDAGERAKEGRLGIPICLVWLGVVGRAVG